MQNPVHFSRRSRRAILIFTVLMLVVVLFPRMYYLFEKPSKFTFSQTAFQQDAYKNRQFKKFERKTYEKRGSKFSVPPSKFDPNKYAVSDWMLLGMSQKQAEIILKFGKRGFYNHEDLKRVFVISEPFFNTIKDSLFYPEKVGYASADSKAIAEKVLPKVEINSATEEELMSLKGIGEFFAKNIVKRRNELGGFRNEAQLLEIWKFDQEKLDAISPRITIDPSMVRKININTATAEELKIHPYIRNWNVANSIVKMRAQVGSFHKIEDIKRSVLVTDEMFEKLKPYITVD